MLSNWFNRKSAESASDFQLESIFWLTNNPSEFMAFLRECRKRFGNNVIGVERLTGNQPLSRLYNVSHGGN